MTLTLPGLSAFAASHGLALLLPLAVVEGPIVSVLAGILCAEGLLPWPQTLALLVLGDLLGGLLYYAIGRTGHGTLHRVALRLGLNVARGEAMAGQLQGHAVRMLLIGKWTHAIGAVVLIAAGAARLPVVRFLLINLLATLPKSALLLGLGMIAGPHLLALSEHLGLLAPGLLVLGLVALWLLLRCPGRKAPS